jgi:cardiolipin synthase
MLANFSTLGPALLIAVDVTLALGASGHVILHKRDVRAAIGWVGLIWLVPIAGAVLYGLFGINRIRRKASALRGPRDEARLEAPPGAALATGARVGALAPLARLLDRVTGSTLTAGNHIEPLEGGSRAYGAMLDGIERAEATVGLASYIFADDGLGGRFARALAQASGRGVAVRVLIDGVGARYGPGSIVRRLAAAGVPARLFLPTRFPRAAHYAQLRNHRKILLVDGRLGFTGGMNIRDGHLEGAPAEDAIADVHFRLDGPVVGHLAETFAEDWAFASGEALAGPGWFPRFEAVGGVVARGIAAGPDERFERIRWALEGALALARRQVRVVTPYFLPDTMLAEALQRAALQGVDVDVVLPGRCNLRLVEWASRAKIADLLARGCRVWLSPPPFDHAKLLTIDGAWSFFGSANWDPRSLRLNFELNVEAYDEGLAARIDALIDRRIAAALPLLLTDVDGRSLAVKLRDGAAWLLSPYL